MTRNGTDAKGRAVLAAVDALRIKLLDLTGRNQLLSFRHSERSRKHVRTVDISPESFFEQLNEGADFRFQPLPEPDDEPADERTAQFRQSLNRAVASDAEYNKELKALGDNRSERAMARAERLLRDRLREQLRLPKRLFPTRDSTTRSDRAKELGIDPSYELLSAGNNRENGRRSKRLQTLLYPDELERKLRGIYEQARSSLEERGVNTLFAAIGFLEWYESDIASASAIYAPLLLYSLEIKRELVKGRYIYSVRSTGDEPSENLSLRERLRRDFSLALPELDIEKHAPDAYFRRVSSAIRDRRDWTVHRYLTIGHFEFTKLPMYHDLDHAKWGSDSAVFAQHAVLSEILGGTSREDAPLFAEEYEIDAQPALANLPQLVTDADSSQLSAVIDAVAGKNLVIQGPPGTGKSQTITNLIAASLADGKRVLFVAEKMAALDVVKSRLDNAGLGEFCLELHSYKAKKRDVLDALQRRRELCERTRDSDELARAISEANRLREQLNRYAKILNQPFGNVSRTLHEILWKCHRLRLEAGVPDFVAEETFPTKRALATTRIDADREKEILAGFERHRAVMASHHGAPENHPWCGVRNDRLTFVEERDVVRSATNLRQNREELLKMVREFNDRSGSSIRTPEELVWLGSIVEALPNPTPSVLSETFPKLATQSARQILSVFIDRSAAIRKCLQTLGEAFDSRERALEYPSGLVDLSEAVDANRLADLTLEGVMKLATDAGGKAREARDLAEFGSRLVHGIAGGLIVTPLTCLTALKAAELASQVSPELIHFAGATVNTGSHNAVPTSSESALPLDRADAPGLNVDRLLKLASSEEARARSVDELAACAGKLIQSLAEDLRSTPLTAAVALRAAEHAIQITPEVLRICSPRILADGGSAIVFRMRQGAERLRAIRDDLSQRLDVTMSVQPSDLRDLAANLRQPHIFPLLSSSVRRARRLFIRHRPRRVKLGVAEMAADLDALADYKEAVAHFEADPQNQHLSAGKRVSLDTDFEAYSVAAEWADRVRMNFGSTTKADQAVLCKLLSGDTGVVENLATLLGSTPAESLRTFLADLEPQFSEDSLDEICARLHQCANDVSAVAEWGERVRKEFADQEDTHEAAKQALR